MLTRLLRSLAIGLLLLAAAPRAGAQEVTRRGDLVVTPEGSIVILTLVDGSTLQGRVLEVTPTAVRFSSALGETTIARPLIRSVTQIRPDQIHDGEVWPEDPSRTRLFFGPTGRMLRQGEGYFSDAYIFFPSLQAGLTDQLSIGAGLSVLPGVPIEEQVYYFTPKVGLIQGPDVNVSVGALIAGANVISDASPFGIGYGVATIGGENANVTAGAGFAFARDNTSNGALLMLGGMTRLSRNVSLVSENYLLTSNGSPSLLSGGLRFMGEKLSVDLAGWFAGGTGFPVPYVAFIYKF